MRRVGARLFRLPFFLVLVLEPVDDRRVGKGCCVAKQAAFVAVEAFGHPGGMIELEQLAQKNELMLIEDCCEGFGGYVGRR